MPKTKPGTNIGLYPVKIGPGDTRYVNAKFGPDGQVRILPPKRPTGSRVVVEPTVNTTIPNPRIMAEVAPIARNLVLRAAKAGDPEPYVYGYTAVRPMVVGADDDSEYLVLDLLWSVGQIEEIEGPYLYIPDVGIVSTAAASPTLHEHFLGTAGQSASAIMTALKGSYGAMANRAHSVVSMQQGWNLNIMGFIYGRHVTDPRTSPHTVAYSANPALVLADVLTLCGYTMDWPSVADAADYCDEGVGTDSPQDKRWQIGGVIRDRRDLRYWVHALAQYCQCYVDIRGGYAILVPDTPRSSNHTVTAASIVEGSERLTRRGSKDAPEAVTVVFRSSLDRTFQKTYGTENGSGTVSQLQMPLWTDFDRAGRKAEETYRKANNEIESLEFIGWDDGLIRTLGDVGTVTLPSVGLSAQDMALVENEPVQRGRWRRKYVEYDATNYTNTTYSGSSTQTTLNNPYAPPTGPTPTLTAELVTSTSPNYYRIKIDFSPVTWAYLRDYKVNVYVDGVPGTILHSEYVAKGSETGSPETITVYADLTDSPGFQMAIGTSPQTVYRVDVYNRSLWTDQEGNEVLSATPGTATVTDPTYVTTAKHFNDGSSPTGYYTIADTTASPAVWDGLIPAPLGSGDTYQKMTLVFSIYVVEHGDDDRIFIFGTTASQFSLGTNDADGGLWLSAKDFSGTIKSITINPSGSPSDFEPLPPGEWHAVMIAYDGDSSVSPQQRTTKIWIDGVEIYNGDWGSVDAANQPHAWSGKCYVGMGDYTFGSAPGHDPDLWEGLNCYLSHVWCNEEYLDPATNWSKFFDASNKPIDVGADGSTPTGSAPYSFFPDADFTNNRGTGNNWTEVGTVPAAPSSPTD